MSIPDLQGKKEPAAPAEPTRFKAFANFFKNYMSVSAVIAAALPIPVAAWKLIPMYDAQRGILGTYTSLFCFLILAFIFYRRHTLARLMFRDSLGLSQKEAPSRFWPLVFSRLPSFLVNWGPAILILLCFASIVAYQSTLQISLAGTYEGGPISHEQAVKEVERILTDSKWYEIRKGELLIGFYLLIFLCAEAAFVLMATKEYLQDLLKVSEHELILGPPAKAG
jgi:hypothetical protein